MADGSRGWVFISPFQGDGILNDIDPGAALRLPLATICHAFSVKTTSPDSAFTFLAVPDLFLRALLAAFDSPAARKCFRITGRGLPNVTTLVFGNLG